ncbi:calcyphosin-like [Patiria miniata]|uniref:EF-hand domain-containing protein n=1 Tax=Patiria miniata TaxID=46514 RepID=A0A913Z9V8_PATMI|nr:calcyphosin-like [Patiria miniata]XP_038048548.1 calcyphosin-like [Patiria miniata]
MEKLRQKLLENNLNDYIKVSRKFKDMDENRSGILDLGELKKGLRALGLSEDAMSDEELKDVFKTLDKDGSGNLNLVEFMDALTPPLSPERKGILVQIFFKVEKTGDGAISPADLTRFYIAKYHPAVLAGDKTEDDIKTEFLNNFEIDKDNRDGKVTLEEFVKYYAGISQKCDSDEEFAEMVKNTWDLY